MELIVGAERLELRIEFGVVPMGFEDGSLQIIEI
jgi:hypothetical protein